MAVNIGDDEPTIRADVEKHQMAYPQLTVEDWDAPVVVDYGIRGLPSIWLISPEGEVIGKRLRGGDMMHALESAMKSGDSS